MDFMTQPKTNKTLSALAKFFEKESLVKESTDCDALFCALETVVDSFYEKGNSQLLESRTHKNEIERDYAQTTEYFNKKLIWIEEQRRKKYESISKSLKNKPNINSASKNCISNSSRPLHQRVEEELKKKNDNLKSLLMEKEIERRKYEEENVTFKPRIHSVTPPRNQKQLVEFLHNRNKIKTIAQRKEIEEIEKISLKDLQEKPNISPRSEKLSEKWCKTPVVNRLHYNKKSSSPDFFSAKPEINPQSQKLAQNRSEKVFSRLYTSKSSSDLIRQNSLPPSEMQEPQPWDGPIAIRARKRSNSPYRVNTGKGSALENKFVVNELECSQKLRNILKKLIK
ncbi:unnamed protein product [Blepharisma stoltei]|uniref:Uncharacterized protein n=1 Tax=Blepharisma stoltei TaxID=1481888 RepID=A0AAU9IS57_9CILI|nr:unnamed protein product [Blepharisma stoltei]